MPEVKKTILFLLLVFGFSAGVSEGNTVTVKVGGYAFPPFVELSDNKKPSGITLDLIKKMNTFQQKYRFEFVLTSPKRRYQSFENGMYDLIFFESMVWGWQGKNVAASKVFLQGGEVYITKKTPEKNQFYFNDFKGKSMAGILGYHYQFADFNSDRTFLESRYNMKLFNRHSAIFKPIITGRIDIAVVTLSYLKNYLKTHPEIKDQIMISKKYDQIYNHTVLVRQNANPSVHDINHLLDEMGQQGLLKALWERYGIQ